MNFLRFVWKEIRSLRLALQITGLVIGIAFLVSVWYLGVEWWMRPVNVAPWHARIRRMRPRLEFSGVIFGLFLAIYLACLIDRYRKGR